MGLNLEYINGQTPIDEDEKVGLLIPTIVNRGELDEFEQKNIEEAIRWLIGRKFKADVVFTDQFVTKLHKQMYGNVWGWAGQFRKTDKNIGIDKWQIPLALRTLNDDGKFWIENKVFSPDEIAIRYKHRIVSIHCFPNGNGRHSRLMADVIIEKIFGKAVFTWGSDNLVSEGGPRKEYLKAIYAADRGDYEPLVSFARS
ncbi:MAG: mobile mystery protein B [Bacteroidales bacterium]|jgi:Fic-DOC domain mobile mystery protein B